MAEEGESTPNVIIDNGTGFMKAGFSGEDGPRAVFPSLVGTPKVKSAMVGVEAKEYYIGNQAEEKRGVLKLRCPLEQGFVTK